MVGADADPSDIGVDVVDPVRDCPAQLGIDEVVDIDELRLALGAPLATMVLEITDQFLALGVDRDDRLIGAEEVHRLVVDIPKLRVAIDVVAAFPCLAVGLQAVAHPAQQIARNRGADRMAMLRQLFDEITQAPAGPQQWSHGVAARHGRNQSLEVAQQRWVLKRLRLSSATRLADTSGRRRHIIANVAKTMINGGASQTRDAGH